MLLSVLIPALPQRDSNDLIFDLIDQARGFDVEVLVIKDESTSGHKRKRLMQQAQGKYVSFVDDDDVVSPFYIRAICQALQSSPDIVTFNLEMTNAGRSETWDLSGVKDIRKQGVMASNHLCVWKKSLASLVPWCPDLGPADDLLWYQPLHAFINMMGLITDRVHIDKTLYHYLYSSTTTVNQNQVRIDQARRFFGKGLRCFIHRGEVVIEHQCQHRIRGGSLPISVLTPSYEIKSIPFDQLVEFHRVIPWFCREQI